MLVSLTVLLYLMSLFRLQGAGMEIMILFLLPFYVIAKLTFTLTLIFEFAYWMNRLYEKTKRKK